MTTFGKILVVLHLVLSVIFMAFAGAVYTAHSNWMKKAGDSKKAEDKAKGDYANLQAEAERERSLASEKQKQLQDDVNSLTGELRQKTDELRIVNVDYNQVKTALDAEKELARLTSEEATERIKEATLQREKNSQLYQTRNEVVTELKQLEEKLFALEVAKQQMEDKYNLLLRDNATMVSFLAAKQLPTDPKLMLTSTKPPVDVDGIVLVAKKAERGGNELVEISIGSDDDLREGHILTVYNRDKFLGQIKLIKVAPDVSVGLVIRKANNSVIQRGDNVTTKL